MCMPDMTEKEKNEILDACRKMKDVQGFISTIKSEQEKLKIEHSHLKEKIDEEILERKEEIKNMHEEFKDMKKQIDNEFSIVNGSIKRIHDRFDKGFKEITDSINTKITKINNWIIGGLSGILGAIVVGFLMLIIGRINGWF